MATDFIPVYSVGPLAAAAGTGASSLDSVVTFPVQMTDNFTAQDAPTYFVARVFYPEDETDEDNQSSMSGDDTGDGSANDYDFPFPSRLSILGFMLDWENGPVIKNVEPDGANHKIINAKTFQFSTNYSEAPVFVQVVVYKVPGKSYTTATGATKKRYMSIGQLEDLTYKTAIEAQLAELQEQLTPGYGSSSGNTEE